MKNLFIPYEQAMTLKELGFDEPCFGFQSKINDLIICNTNGKLNEDAGECLVPIYQQAFDWLREKHKLHGEPTSCYKLNAQNNPCGNEWQIYTYELSKLEDGKCDEEVYADYEIARLECLKKLILILKTKQ